MIAFILVELSSGKRCERRFGGGRGVIEFSFLANDNKETSSQTFGVLDMRHTMT